MPLSGLELVKLALLVYELVEQVEEAGFVVVADVLDVPQAGLADLGAGGVMAEPSATGLVQPIGEARRQGDAVTLHAAAVVPLLDGKPQKRHRPDVAADGLLDPRLLVRLPWPGSVAVEPGIQ